VDSNDLETTIGFRDDRPASVAPLKSVLP
jgi:hypothetical protein